MQDKKNKNTDRNVIAQILTVNTLRILEEKADKERYNSP